MYLRHFNFKSKPFAMNPDPAFLYPSAQHSNALTMLEYALESEAAFCVLTGEVGSGKTTLVRRLVRTVGEATTVGMISNTHASFQSIHPWALLALGLAADLSETGRYEALTGFFVSEYAKGRRTLLIVDEAQNLAVQALEELRLLSNLNSEEDVALQILLVGQPELRATIARPELKQFAQRVAVDFHLDTLDPVEAEAYVRHRLRVAGGSDCIFQQPAIMQIYRHAGGVPRLINQICDLALVYAYAESCDQVTPMLVAQMLKDKDSGRMAKNVHAHSAVPPADDGLLLERA